MARVVKARKQQVEKPGSSSRRRRAGPVPGAPGPHLCDQLGRGLALVLHPCCEKKKKGTDCATPPARSASAYEACTVYGIQCGVGYGRGCVVGLRGDPSCLRPPTTRLECGPQAPTPGARRPWVPKHRAEYSQPSRVRGAGGKGGGAASTHRASVPSTRPGRSRRRGLRRFSLFLFGLRAALRCVARGRPVRCTVPGRPARARPDIAAVGVRVNSSATPATRWPRLTALCRPVPPAA